MDNVIIREATYKDCNALAPRLRDADITELALGAGKAPLQALEDSIRYSKVSWSVVKEGEVAAIFGVGQHPLDPKVGVPWLLASHDIEDFPVKFLRGSLSYVRLMQSWFPILTNVVDAEHTDAQRWLEWCGFQRGKTYRSYGVGKVPFIQYIRY